MKILTLSSSDRIGGAAIAAYRLHKSLNSCFEKENFTSTMLVGRCNTKENDIRCSKSKLSYLYLLLKSGVAQRFNKLQSTSNKGYHSCSLFPTNIHKKINNSNFDLVNLHWVQGEFISIESIGKISKPIVWTLHDTWAFSGSEHYPIDINDKRYKEIYSSNNRPKYHKGFDIDKWCWNRKLRSWKNNFHIVTPSKWLGDMARESFLMRKFSIHTIPNALDTNVFMPLDKSLGRNFFNLPQSKTLILFGAFVSLNDHRKGLDLLLKALKILESKTDEIEIVILGSTKIFENSENKFKFHFIPKLTDDASLSLCYSSVDLVVLPSRMENLPNMAIEAQSCGTPLVAFNVTGISECVCHQKTGYLAKPYQFDDLAKGIEWVIENNKDSKLSEEARQRAVRLWNKNTISKKYYDLYTNILEENYLQV